MWIEHVLGAADEVPAEKKCAEQIEHVDSLKNQQSDRLPGNNQTALKPESQRDQEIAKIAKVKKILRSILTPVHGDPCRQPEGPGNLQPQRNALL